MTRETSRKAYEFLISSGVLKGNQAKILHAVIGGPDRTSGEVCAALGLDNVNAWRARFTELQERGLIAESGQRKCQISGRACVTWRFTDRSKPLEVKHRASASALRALLKRTLPFVGQVSGKADPQRPGQSLADEIRAVL